MVNQVLLAPGVHKAIQAEAGDDAAKLAAARAKARDYAMEIAADISYPTIRLIQRVLRWLWNRIYDGIELRHVERLHDVAKQKEVIYVPCHRSHFDYLLLGYIGYEEGLHLPHIAAGINLNLPVVGPILRRGGAFFLRRSFRGNRLYAAVFDAYLHQVLVRGHSIEYFVEGGRSRTGRLLEPKGGMLAMTVRSYHLGPEATGRVRADLFRLRKTARGRRVHQRARRRRKEVGIAARPDPLGQGAARELRQRVREYRGADRPRTAADRRRS